MWECFKGFLSFEGLIFFFFILMCGLLNVVFWMCEYGKYKISLWGKWIIKIDFFK